MEMRGNKQDITEKQFSGANCSLLTSDCSGGCRRLLQLIKIHLSLSDTKPRDAFYFIAASRENTVDVLRIS